MFSCFQVFCHINLSIVDKHWDKLQRYSIMIITIAWGKATSLNKSSLDFKQISTLCLKKTSRTLPPHLMFASALPRKNRTSEICIEINKKVNKFHLSGSVAQKLANYKVWLSCSSVSTRWRLGMLMNSKTNGWSLDWSGAEHYRHCYQQIQKASL